LQILHRSRINVSGQHAVIVGRSEIVGKPMALLLGAKESHLGPTACNATVTVCHSKTRDLPAICRQADILVAAIGRPKFITGDMIKPGAAVIDVGINRTEAGLAGDVDFAAAKQVAGAITPVPRGVGPMTIVMLLHNTLAAARAQIA
jgi:methylenetetrahydrofolate dehydrogenase (NADP+)/methenyltetrahydrofolate cyclohydrolase